MATTRQRTAEPESRSWRRLYNAVLHYTSLFCRWLWSAVKHDEKAVELEVELEELRAEIDGCAERLQGAVTSAVLRYGIDRSQTGMDEDVVLLAELCKAGWAGERRQAREIAASVLDQLRARNAAAQANGLLESVQGHGVVGQWAA